MELGVFAKTFPRPTFEGTLDAVVAHGLRAVQFNLEGSGLPSLPDEIPNAVVDQIRRETASRGIRIAAVSGTYNMAHPDPRVRARGLARLRVIAAACHGMGTSVVTLCTGTRDPEDMWRGHPANDSTEAWRDLLGSMEAALAIAEQHDLTLAIEPEPANVVRNAVRGRRLMEELTSPRLGVVMDAANIIAGDQARSHEDLLGEAFDLLGEHVVVAHAKDRDADGNVCAAGQGLVPWDRVVALLAAAGFDGPPILHGLAEKEVAGAAAFLRERIAAVNDRRGGHAGNGPI